MAAEPSQMETVVMGATTWLNNKPEGYSFGDDSSRLIDWQGDGEQYVESLLKELVATQKAFERCNQSNRALLDVLRKLAHDIIDVVG